MSFDGPRHAGPEQADPWQTDPEHADPEHAEPEHAEPEPDPSQRESAWPQPPSSMGARASASVPVARATASVSPNTFPPSPPGPPGPPSPPGPPGPPGPAQAGPYEGLPPNYLPPQPPPTGHEHQQQLYPPPAPPQQQPYPQQIPRQAQPPRGPSGPVVPAPRVPAAGRASVPGAPMVGRQPGGVPPMPAPASRIYGRPPQPAQGDYPASAQGGHPAPAQPAPGSPPTPMSTSAAATNVYGGGGGHPGGAVATRPTFPAGSGPAGSGYDKLSDGFRPSGPPERPPAAPGKSRKGLLIGGLAGVLLLAVIGVGGYLYLQRTGTAEPFPVSSCVRQSGSTAVAARCTDAGAFIVVSKVDSPDQCDDAAQPYLELSGTGPRRLLCLTPASGSGGTGATPSATPTLGTPTLGTTG